jgi:hypothetical protein
MGGQRCVLPILRESNAVRLASELREADDSEAGQLTSLSWNVEPHR